MLSKTTSDTLFADVGTKTIHHFHGLCIADNRSYKT